MSKNKFFIERRPAGDYAIRGGDSKRASAVASTQREAIQQAHKMDPDAAMHVERVRDTAGGSRDKWTQGMIRLHHSARRASSSAK